MKDILKEAIAEAKLVKSVAIENAKEVLIESFTPKIQSMLSTKLHEEDIEDPVDNKNDEEIPSDDEVNEENVLDDQQKKNDSDVTPDFKEGIDDTNDDQLNVGEDEPIEDDEEDLEIESILDELDAEDEEKPVDEPTFEDEPVEDEPVEEGEFEDNPDITGADDKTPVESDNEEEIDISELLNSLDEEEYPGDDNAENKNSEEQNVVKQMENIRKQNSKLKKQLSEYEKTVNYLRSELKEINLLNTKLLHTTKIFKNFDVNSKNRKEIIETFDRAKTPREVKLIYATLYEAYKTKVNNIKKDASLKSITEVTNSASTQVNKTTVPEKVMLVEGQDFVNRMKKLANIK